MAFVEPTLGTRGMPVCMLVKVNFDTETWLERLVRLSIVDEGFSDLCIL